MDLTYLCNDVLKIIIGKIKSISDLYNLHVSCKLLNSLIILPTSYRVQMIEECILLMKKNFDRKYNSKPDKHGKYWKLGSKLLQTNIIPNKYKMEIRKTAKGLINDFSGLWVFGNNLPKYVNLNSMLKYQLSFYKKVIYIKGNFFNGFTVELNDEDTCNIVGRIELKYGCKLGFVRKFNWAVI